jgi:hypothetical protein
MFLIDLLLIFKPDLALRLFVCGKQFKRAQALINQGKATKSPRRRGGEPIDESDINMSINPAMMARMNSEYTAEFQGSVLSCTLKKLHNCRWCDGRIDAWRAA